MKLFTRFIKGILLKGNSADPTDNLEGSIWVNNSDNRIRSYIEANTHEVTTNKQVQYLENKTLDDATTAIVDNLDNTKRIEFNADGDSGTTTTLTSSQTGTSKTLILPDANDTLVGRDTTDTLTNKTIDADNNIISNIEDDNIKSGAGINATKISNGSVDNTEFNYLDGLTSNIQTQLNGKVTGPLSATDNALVRYDGTTGKLVQSSGTTLSDTGDMIIEKDLTVLGNLQVDGTTTTLNTATLDVEDVNITVNKNGNQTSADDVAGLTVEMSDATDVKLIYDKDVPSRWKAGDAGAEIELANVSSAQTLTNKTIVGSSNTISGLVHGTQVDNPSSGVHGVTGSVVGTSDIQNLRNKGINSDFDYKGFYDPITNDPFLVDGVGTNLDLYKIINTGSRDFGSGLITFTFNDFVYYNGSTWQKLEGPWAFTQGVSGSTDNNVLFGPAEFIIYSDVPDTVIGTISHRVFQQNWDTKLVKFRSGEKKSGSGVGNTGDVIFYSGDNSAGPSGLGNTGLNLIKTGDNNSGGNTGLLKLRSGYVNQSGGLGSSGNVEIYTGNTVDGNTGNIDIRTGTGGPVPTPSTAFPSETHTGAGVRGNIRIHGKDIRLGIDGNTPAVNDVWTAKDTSGNGQWSSLPRQSVRMVRAGAMTVTPLIDGYHVSLETKSIKNMVVMVGSFGATGTNGMTLHRDGPSGPATQPFNISDFTPVPYVVNLSTPMALQSGDYVWVSIDSNPAGGVDLTVELYF